MGACWCRNTVISLRNHLYLQTNKISLQFQIIMFNSSRTMDVKETIIEPQKTHLQHEVHKAKIEIDKCRDESGTQ